MINTLLTVTFWVFFLLLSTAFGRKVIGYFGLRSVTGLEHFFINVSFGLGVIGISYFFLGLVGLFHPIYLVLILLAVSLWSRHEIVLVIRSGKTWIDKIQSFWGVAGFGSKALILGLSLIGLLTFFQALTPAWDYDGLMYHLEGPKLFLSAGRVYVLPDLHQANGPFLIEMLFALGVGLKLDSFAKLIHLSYAVLLCLVTFGLGKRYLENHDGWIPAAIMASVPINTLLASFAYIDYGWALYEAISVYLFMLWVEERESVYLVLAGIYTGFALGTKYLALIDLGILGIFIIVYTLRKGARSLFKNIFFYGSAAVIVGFSWYLKNWILTGNPIYPMYFGGIQWPVERVQDLMTYLNSFGTGKSIWDYILLPLNLFRAPIYYSTVGEIERPNILFLFVLGYPWLKRSKWLTILALIALLRFFIWGAGSQQVRFLLPIYPILSVLSAQVLSSITLLVPWNRIRNTLIPGLVAGAVISTLILSFYLFIRLNPLPYVMGFETKGDFLSRMEGNYQSLQFLGNKTSPRERVFMMWDGRSYYCEANCIPDSENNLWTTLFLSKPNAHSIAAYMKEVGVKYLLFNPVNANFMLGHDPKGEQLRALEFLFNEFVPTCADEIYKDSWIWIYEINCN